MELNEQALRILINWLVPKLADYSIPEQIAVYGILAELMPAPEQRAAARDISLSLSRASAMQLEFTETLFARNDSGNRGSEQTDGGGK